MSANTSRRVPLNRERVLRAGVALADRVGLDALSMRRLAQELDVVPMALYKHVAHRDELIAGMVDALIQEIDPPALGLDWKATVRQRVLSARSALLRHPWARPALESRTAKTPTVLGYIDSMIGIFLAGGFSPDLTHHVMHAFGSRMWGLTQEVFEEAENSTPAGSPEEQSAMFEQLAAAFPNVAHMAVSAAHDSDSVVGQGCDDQFEFEFALDLMLDGFERLRDSGWTSRAARAQSAH